MSHCNSDQISMQYNGMLGTNRPVYLGDVSRLMCRELAIYVASTLNYVQKNCCVFSPNVSILIATPCYEHLVNGAIDLDGNLMNKIYGDDSGRQYVYLVIQRNARIIHVPNVLLC